MVFEKGETDQGIIVENSETGPPPKGHLIYDKKWSCPEPEKGCLFSK